MFDLDRKRSRIALIERESTLPNFWDDNTKAQALLKEKNGLEASVGAVERVQRGLDDAKVLFELGTEMGDEASLQEADASLAPVEADLGKLELARMLSGENDANSCFVEINAGAGGTDSMDWAAMLLRMYTRYCEARGWKVEINDFVAGEEAGVKNVSFTVTGEYAYGYLKAEVGVHRLVRISPFDANARRQTAFASVAVYPEIDDAIVIDIPEKDVRVDVYRASGAGGQKVNKTSSAVRLTHIPTGITVAMQNERSQHANRDMAWKILRSRLYEAEMRKREAERDAVEANKKDIAFGSQIRSYVLAPYRMVKDLRTGVETGNVDAVLDGELEDFITAMLLGVKNPNRSAAE
ncbi:peptide chain release factor 2 [Aggregicoccus sp. 17bor-14]|nr:peptide chain release factor 2 [Simulacricoccus sp. 17bor-14]MRI92056.1 peptide chain release factor 2 [Aggregicoccus sp. 17bor-14]